MTDKESTGPSLKLFGALSALYMLWAISGAWYRHYFALSLSPSEWATVLEGVFSPLAFLWLLYAALSQRAELALQRHELQQNNETQQQQQKQMRRQADALERQMESLMAQADARYEPIVVMKTIFGHGTGASLERVELPLVNLGSDVLTVRPGASVVLRKARAPNQQLFERLSGEVLPHWANNGFLVVEIALAEPDQESYSFELNFTRLDAEERRHVYVWLPNQNRVELVGVITLNPLSKRISALARSPRTGKE